MSAKSQKIEIQFTIHFLSWKRISTPRTKILTLFKVEKCELFIMCRNFSGSNRKNSKPAKQYLRRQISRCIGRKRRRRRKKKSILLPVLKKWITYENIFTILRAVSPSISGRKNGRFYFSFLSGKLKFPWNICSARGKMYYKSSLNYYIMHVAFFCFLFFFFAHFSEKILSY